MIWKRRKGAHLKSELDPTKAKGNYGDYENCICENMLKRIVISADAKHLTEAWA